ncbi:MAG TPA: hypothetical protein PK208_07235 [Fibrobacteria bacterium]|nr:hypothetical protein [Fibrobacteria bacterium]
MTSSISVRSTAAALGLALALLAGCKPHETHGTVDEANAITVVDVAKLGLAEAKKRYEGKIVTFKGPLEPTGVAGKNEAKPNACIQGFLKRFRELPEKIPSSVPGTSYQDGGLYVFFNFGDEMQEWLGSYNIDPKNVPVANSLLLEEDMCDTAGVCSEGDLAGERKCKFSSDRFLVSGQVVSIHEEGEGAGFKIELRPTGLRY